MSKDEGVAMKRMLLIVLFIAVVVAALLFAASWLDLAGMVKRIHGH